MPDRVSRKESTALWKKYFALLHRLALRMSSMQMDEERKTRLLEQLGNLGVLKNPNIQQQSDLVRFVFDASIVINHTPKKKWLREERRSPQQLRMLNRKVMKLKRVFEELNTYWTHIGGNQPDGAFGDLPEDELVGNVYLVRDLEAEYSVTGSLEQIGAAIDALDLPARVELGTRLQPMNNKAVIATALNEFFVSGCRRSKRESEIRIAKIGNTFWKWGFAVREKWAGGDTWRGCEAVRKLLKR